MNTKKESWKQMQFSLNMLQKRIFAYLKRCKYPKTSREICREVKLERNCVTARLNELVGLKQVLDNETQYDMRTNRTVKVYKVNPNRPPIKEAIKKFVDPLQTKINFKNS